LFTAVLAVIEAAVLIYFIIILLKRRKYQKLYNTPAVALNIPPPTMEERILYTIKHRRRVAELASAIAREMKLPKKLVKMLLMFGRIALPCSPNCRSIQHETERLGLSAETGG
jgi:HD-GYP domain-containing protein (c-di-GMP phosphodiesterase class II)